MRILGMYKDTLLWRRTLGSEEDAVSPLRDSFLKARENTIFLLDKIRNDFPNLTIHDITHVDSLWEVADTIIGDNNYPINPLEGYVLGIAFLIHDAALSYDAVGGKEKLRETDEWKDAYADKPMEIDDEEFKKECDFIAIRSLHAKKAETILSQTFSKDNGTTFYIIDDDIFRTHYENLIGKIAASHHWNIDKVDSELKRQKNPRRTGMMPRHWTINPKKLACLLRCADAGHIDDGRAPDKVYDLLTINGVSREHWKSQNRLGQVAPDEIENDKLCITSTQPFKKEDFAAWNVAFDAVKIFDEEIKKSNRLLKEMDPKLEFPYLGISGSESKEALSKYIETEGWKPCDLNIHASNMKGLIESLGGSRLYGEENMLLVALRELIQNARDAIHARSYIDSFKDGKITIRINENDKIIEVEDNGIGMSIDCIKYHLLNFGSSYWKSSLLKYEYPGLKSSGFTSIGQFGIGFFSVFMVAKSVEVITKRYHKGCDEFKKLEFPAGLTLSPILSKPEQKLSPSISTIIRFQLKSHINLSCRIFYKEVQIEKALKILVAGLDSDVYFKDENEERLIHTNINSSGLDKESWLHDIIIDNVNYPKEVLKPIVDQLDWLEDDKGKRIGMVAIPDYSSSSELFHLATKYHRLIKEDLPFIETVGGLATLSWNTTIGITGYIDLQKTNIDRNGLYWTYFKYTKSARLLQKWIKRKYDENYSRIVSSQLLADNYTQAIRYSGLITDEIVETNIEKIVLHYKEFGVIPGTIQGLKQLHRLMFAGITDTAGQYRVHNNISFRDYSASHKESVSANKLDEELPKIDQMLDNSIEEAILKYIKIEKVCPFVDGNGRCNRIWINLYLMERWGYIIEWNNIHKGDYYNLLNQSTAFNESLGNTILNYLKDHMKSVSKTEETSKQELVQSLKENS